MADMGLPEFTFAELNTGEHFNRTSMETNGKLPVYTKLTNTTARNEMNDAEVELAPDETVRSNDGRWLPAGKRNPFGDTRPPSRKKHG